MFKSKVTKFTAILLIMVLSMTCLWGCGSKDKDEGSKEAAANAREVIDAAGNKVEVPANLDKIAVIPLPWSSVIFAIDGTSEHMRFINPGAMTAYKGHFLETLDKNYGNLDTSAVGKDFSINMEQIASDGVQACVIWANQPEVAEKLKEIGIVPIMVNNGNVEQLQASLKAVGQMLGKEGRAQQFIDLYADTYKKIKSYSKEVESAEKPKVLYLRNANLKTQGNDNFIKEALEMAGADNICSDSTEITMEEIIKKDPDIILLSNFDSFVPDDFYENSIEGQDWSQVKAVKEKRVYKTPIGIYRWDAPGVETPLMMEWLATLIQPEVFKDINVNKDTKDFFKKYFKVELSQKDMNQIMNGDANKNSKTE